MSTFDEKSLKNGSIHSTSTHERSMPCSVKADSYGNSPQIKNDTTSENLTITESKAHVPPIEIDSEVFAKKYVKCL